MNYLYIFLLIILLIFPIYKEYTDQSHCYLNFVPDDKDNEKVIYKKLTKCISADKLSIIWRRSFISAIISLILITILIFDGKLPSYRDSIFYTLIIFCVYYNNWINYNSTITEKIEKLSKIHIRKLKKLSFQNV